MADINPWYFDPYGAPASNAIDVYDHEGTQVADDITFGTNAAEDNGVWRGDFPNKVFDIIRQEMDGSGTPTAYNQEALAVAATEFIKKGVPWQRVRVGTDTLSTEHPTPTLSAPAFTSAPTGELSTEHPVPTVSAPATVSATTGEVSAEHPAPTLSAPAFVSAPTEELSTEHPEPSLS